MPRTLQIESINTTDTSTFNHINATGSTILSNLIVSSQVSFNNTTNSGSSNILGNANVSGNANIIGDTNINGSSNISGNANITGNANISGNANIIGNFSVGRTGVDAGVKMQVVGVLKATQFSGDGSLLTGIVGVGGVGGVSSSFTVNNIILNNLTGINPTGNILYTNPSSTISLVRRVDIMNSNDNIVNTQMFYVPSVSGAVSTMSASNKILDVDLPGKSSLRLLVPNGMALSRTNDTIQAIIDASGFNGSLNIKMIGETGTAGNINMRDLVGITGISSTALPLVRNITNSKINIYNMLFHNTSSSVETVKIFDVLNSGGNLAAISSGNQISELTLSGADTLIFGEEYNMILNRLQNTNDSLYFSTTTSGAVNLMVFGETGANV